MANLISTCCAVCLIDMVIVLATAQMLVMVDLMLFVTVNSSTNPNTSLSQLEPINYTGTHKGQAPNGP